jgi:isoleucyl-tRNA synthetase
MSFKKVEPRVNLPELEADVLKYWDKNKIFEKSVQNRAKDNTFSFYDGPPFATGTPHYGHLLAGTIKDVIPRFKSMQGYRVERIWGWDTHGLPIENIVEQELDFKSKDEINELGIDKFNEKCKTKVLEYAEEWEKIVGRTGRWADMKNAYLTMNPEYMESVWWAFSELYKKGLAYEGHKVMPYCPRCATPLSNFEVGDGYEDKTDKAITVKFELADEPKTYFLAWTTTPWTLPGNLALAVGPKLTYISVEKSGAKYILAKERLEDYKEEIGTKIVKEFKGSDLIGKKYKSVMSCYSDILQADSSSKAFEVIAGEHVTTDDGTGIVHTAPAFGEEDFVASKKAGIDFFMPVDDMGRFTIEVPDYAGASVIAPDTNQKIIDDLGGAIIKVETLTHSYPHCWRCHTPLIYRGVGSWFVAIEKIKKELLAENKKIYWLPESVGKGRFANLLKDAPDWSISRNRFWGTPIPVWKCSECNELQVVGSIAELQKLSRAKVTDLHLHKINNIELPCKCGGKAQLTSEVFDCWFESGSMPYASIHYPFENKEKFERDFPANFIAEGVDQTRGWFRSMLVMSVALFGESSYKSVVVNGTVLAENGQKMSKHLKNYPDPMDLVDKTGADSMRFYLMSSPATKAEDLRFTEKGVDEVVKKVILTLWNSYGFFTTYAVLDGFKPTGKLGGKNLLDKWLITKTNKLVLEVTESLEKYEIAATTRLLSAYIDELSNWYIRRSRKRFWKSENDTDKNAAYETLYFALTTYAKLLAPFMPFVTDSIYQNLTGEESVHLADWPVADEKEIDKNIEEQMEVVRKVVEAGLSARNVAQLKVRQPLAKLSVTSPVEKMPEDLVRIIAEEVNVKEVEFKKGKEVSVKLDTKITPELKAEGIARDFVRFIQDGRKKAGFNVEDRINISISTSDELIRKSLFDHWETISHEILFEGKGDSVEFGGNKVSGHEYEEEVKLNGAQVWFGISRKK